MARDYTGWLVAGGRWGRGAIGYWLLGDGGGGIVWVMPLEDLLETIETLRGRIRDHRPLLGQNEIRTRYALIDPLLRALGWDIDDPSEVVPEQDASGGRADYALLRAGQPEVMVEAKKLGTPLQSAVQQGVVYCMEKGTRYFAVTDGQHWAVYDTQQSGPLLDRVITEFDLGGSSAEASLKALALWRPSVVEGHVREGSTPVLQEVGPVPTGTPPPPVTEGGWVKLAGQRPEQGAPKPTEVQCPSGERLHVKNWHGLRRVVVKWLVESGHLAAADAKDPDYHMNSANEVKRAEANIKHAGLDPADFKVRLAD